MNKATSTIGKKPEVNPGIENWINSANPGTSVSAVIAVQPASQQASKLDSLEATTMLSVRIPAGLHHELRVHSVSTDRQIQEIVIELLQAYLHPNV